MHAKTCVYFSSRYRELRMDLRSRNVACGFQTVKILLTYSMPSSSLISPLVSKMHMSPSTDAEISFSFLKGWNLAYKTKSMHLIHKANVF